MLQLFKTYFKKVRSSYRHFKAGKNFDVNDIKLIFIDPCFNMCNLRCPYCPVGMHLQLKDMSKGMLTLDTLKEIYTKNLTNYRGKIGLYNWGDPFLNPDIVEIVRFIKKNSPAHLILNSNFSFSHDDRVTEILKLLGNDTIIISCDGFSQETCEKYRVNVNFEKVMHNVDLMVRNKKQETILKWQYLIFPWNADDLQKAKDFSEKNNIIFYTGQGGITPDYPMLPSPFSFDSNKFRCEFFYDALTINYDGEVYPCCAFYGPEQYSLGNAAKESLKDIFTKGRGKEMLDYLTFRSKGNDDLFCKICIDRNSGILDSWKI